MKYQKSMMKIMENILYNKDNENFIENIIKNSHTGRNSTFAALKWLSENGFIKIRKFGNQKKVIPIIDNYTLQYKYYLDSIKFKTLDPLIKLITEILVFEFFSKKQINFAVLFGSALKNKEYNDIDFLLLGDELDSEFVIKFKNIREKIERIFGVIINLHIGKNNLDNIFKGIIVYETSYLNFKNQLQIQYFDFLEFVLDALKNQNDKKIFKISFENALVNLSYIYCNLNFYKPQTKKEAIDLFIKKYNVKTIDDLKKRGIEIGEEIFR
jgi:predicted nucleotidyltransferase